MKPNIYTWLAARAKLDHKNIRIRVSQYLNCAGEFFFERTSK